MYANVPSPAPLRCVLPRQPHLKRMPMTESAKPLPDALPPLPVCTQIPREELVVGAWYIGKGRNSDLGMWDGAHFLVIGQTGIRTGPRAWAKTWAVKREPYFGPAEGCFQPFKQIAMGQVVEPFGDELHYATTMCFPQPE